MNYYQVHGEGKAAMLHFEQLDIGFNSKSKIPRAILIPQFLPQSCYVREVRKLLTSCHLSDSMIR